MDQSAFIYVLLMAIVVGPIVTMAATTTVPAPAPSSDGTCFRSGAIVGSVLGTFFATVILCVISYYVYIKLVKRKRRSGRPSNKSGRSVPNGIGDETDNHPSSKYAYDNPFFDDDQETGRHLSLDAAEKGEIGTESLKRNTNVDSKNSDNVPKPKKGKLAKANLLSVLTNSKVNRHRAQDDSCLNLEPEVISVPLRGIDFTGLGFNVCGNMRDGIFIKDVLHRGPAMESGKIKAGDRIVSVTVSFTNMVYEDALTILSYASPYDVSLEVQKTAEINHIVGHHKKGSNGSNMSGIVISGGSNNISGLTTVKERLYHPLYRSHSIADLSKIGRDERCSSSASTVKIQTGNKKDIFVRASQSLREEASIDLDTSGSMASSTVSESGGKSPRNNITDRQTINQQPIVSRFKVQKVVEMDESKMVNSSAPIRKISKSSVNSEHSGTIKNNPIEVNGNFVDVPISFTPDEVLLSTNNSKSPIMSSEHEEKVVEADDDAEDEKISSNFDQEKFQLILLDSDSQSLQHSGTVAAAKRSGAAGKRKAPPPPQSSSSSWTPRNNDTHHVTMLKVSPDIHEVPSWVTSTDYEDLKNNVGNVAIQTNFSSESESSDDEIAKKKRKIKAPSGDVRQLKKATKKKERNRRATSLGDLTNVTDNGHPKSKNYPLERSVSMDLNHAETLPLGAQHDQIKSEMEVDEDNDEDNGIVLHPLKKQFAAFENLHLDNIYKKSWDSLDKQNDDHELTLASPKTPLNKMDVDDEDDFQDIVLLANNDNNNNNNNNSGTVVVVERNKIIEDNMSDVSLSDKMSDVSCSLSDDNDSLDVGITKHVKVVKKMTPVAVSIPGDQESSSSSTSEDDDIKEKITDETDDSTFLSMVSVPGNQKDQDTYIRHDFVTGSSLVTIGSSPPIPHPRSKHPNASTAMAVTSATLNGEKSTKIDPKMAKIFNKITVSNTAKDVTVDLENGTVIEDTLTSGGHDHDDDDVDFFLKEDINSRYHHTGNGQVGANQDGHYESTLKLDIVQAASKEPKVELVSLEEEPVSSQQEHRQNGNSDRHNTTSSYNGTTVIIPSPRLKEVISENELSTGSPESPPPTLQPAE